jgi:hypothetical protein
MQKHLHSCLPKSRICNYRLQKNGNKNSPFILGQLQEGSSAETLDNKSNKMRGELNIHLKAISTKLNLALPLRINTVRECYSTTLREPKTYRPNK